MHQTKTKSVSGFQWLRIFAALGVVVIHVCAGPWYGLAPDSPQFTALALWSGLVRWPVPVFVMITGALFLPRVTTLRQALTRYIPRIAAAFLLWSGVYTFWAIRQGATGSEALLKLVTGEYHMWYLPFLCGIYLVLPFVQKIVTDRQLEDALLAVSVTVGLGIPWLADLGAALWPGRADLLRAMENSLNFTFFFDLLAYLVLGHRLHSRELSRRQRRILYLLGLLSLLANGPAAIWLSRRLGAPSTLLFDHASPTTFLAAAALFLFADRHLTRLPRAVDALSRLTFGVYLSHALVLHVLLERGISALSRNPYWFVPVLSGGVFAVCMALSWILSKIPGIGRWVT